MSGFYNELCTVHEVRSEYLDPLGLSSAVDDPLILSIIRSHSAAAARMSNRQFVPQVATRIFDVPPVWDRNIFSGIPRLDINDDLLEIDTLTNGDGTVVTSSQYVTYPLNRTPIHQIALKSTQGLLWQSTQGNKEGAISIAGVWGYHEDYTNAWQDTGATLQASLASSDTSATVQTGLVQAGFLIRLDLEYLYVSAVTTGSPNDTLTLVRAVNGSTAAAHNSDVSVQRWQTQVGLTIRTATAGTLRLRDNPIGDTIRIDGQTFQTPRGVLEYIDRSLRQQGLEKVGIG